MSFYGKRYFNFKGNFWRGFRLGNKDKENYSFPNDEDVPATQDEILFFPTVDYDEGTVCSGNHWIQIKRGDKVNTVEIWHSKPGVDNGENNSLKGVNKQVDEGTITDLKGKGKVISPHDTITFTIFHYDAAGHISSTTDETYWMDDERIVALEKYKEALNITVGDDSHIIYWKAGMPVVSTGTVGSAIKPIWLNKGALTASDGTVGANDKFTYLNQGTITASTANIGDKTKLIYLANGQFIASDANVGDENTPVYVKNGKLVPLDFSVAEGPGALLMEWDGTSWVPSTASVGASNKPIFLSLGRFVSTTANIGSPTQFLYMENGELKPSALSVGGTGDKLLQFVDGQIVESTATVGSPTQLTYLKEGTITASDGNAGSNTQFIYLNKGTFTPSNADVGAVNKFIYLAKGVATASNLTAGANNKFVYVNGGAVTASNLTAGANDQFVYFNGGTVTASTLTAGATNKYVYFDAGKIKTSSSTIGGVAQPIYLNAGAFTALSATVGSAAQPVYLNQGVITAISFYSGNGSLGEHDANNMAYNGHFYYQSNGPAQSLGATTNDGAIYAQAHSATWVGQIAQDYRNGHLFVRGKNNNTWTAWQVVPIAASPNIGDNAHPVYFKNGVLTPTTINVGEGTVKGSTPTVGGHTQPVWLQDNTIVASTGNVGSVSKPVYLKNGVLTPCNDIPASLIGDYLPLTGGTLTGNLIFKGTQMNIKYNNGTTEFPMISMYAGDNNGAGLLIGSGGRTIIGSGESCASLREALGTTNDSIEQTYVAADDAVNIVTGCQTIANRKTFFFSSAGNFTAPGDITGNRVYGAVWNDYAEYRNVDECADPGRVVVETSEGKMRLAHERLEPAPAIISDTYGFAIGKTNNAKVPIAIAGRVLAYPYENKDEFTVGDAVCSGPDGTVSRMTREEIIQYPDRILGIVSEIPQYDYWSEKNVQVYNRIWIRIK